MRPGPHTAAGLSALARHARARWTCALPPITRMHNDNDLTHSHCRANRAPSRIELSAPVHSSYFTGHVLGFIHAVFGGAHFGALFRLSRTAAFRHRTAARALLRHL